MKRNNSWLYGEDEVTSEVTEGNNLPYKVQDKK